MVILCFWWTITLCLLTLGGPFFFAGNGFFGCVLSFILSFVVAHAKLFPLNEHFMGGKMKKTRPTQAAVRNLNIDDGSSPSSTFSVTPKQSPEPSFVTPNKAERGVQSPYTSGALQMALSSEPSNTQLEASFESNRYNHTSVAPPPGYAYGPGSGASQPDLENPPQRPAPSLSSPIPPPVPSRDQPQQSSSPDESDPAYVSQNQPAEDF